MLEVQIDTCIRIFIFKTTKRHSIELDMNHSCSAYVRLIVVDGKYTKIITNVYWEQTASVRIMNELSDEIEIQRGVRQLRMCCISHSFQSIHGKDFQAYYQYEGCQRGRQTLQQSWIC